MPAEEIDTRPREFVGYPRANSRTDTELVTLRGLRRVRVLMSLSFIFAAMVALLSIANTTIKARAVVTVGIFLCCIAMALSVAYSSVLKSHMVGQKKGVLALGALMWIAAPIVLTGFKPGSFGILIAIIVTVFRFDSEVEKELNKRGFRSPGWFGLDGALREAIRQREAVLSIEAPPVPANLYSGDPPK